MFPDYPLGPLVAAASTGNSEVVQFLLDWQSPNSSQLMQERIKAQADPGTSILGLASSPEVVDMLIAAGADPNQRLEMTKWPTAMKAMFKTMGVIVASGSKDRQMLFCANWEGSRPLHLAACAPDAKASVVRALCAAGADPRQRNGRGLTPLEIAQECGFEVIAEELRTWLQEWPEAPKPSQRTYLRCCEQPAHVPEVTEAELAKIIKQGRAATRQATLERKAKVTHRSASKESVATTSTAADSSASTDHWVDL